jgi:hypothetical protein
MSRLTLLPLLAVLLLAGCGLPGNYYLEPPSPPTTPATPSNGEGFTLTTTSRGGDIGATFFGYEYYYKCYSTDAAAYSQTGFGADNQYTELVSAGFLLLCRGVNNTGSAADSSPGNRAVPLLRLDTADVGSVFAVTLWINKGESPAELGVTAPASYLRYDSPSNATADFIAIEARRFVAGTTLCKTFDSNARVGYNGNWFGTDADTTAAMLTEINGDGLLYIVMYAVSYGRGDDGSFVRSSPVCLGYTRTQVLY